MERFSEPQPYNKNFILAFATKTDDLQTKDYFCEYITVYPNSEANILSWRVFGVKYVHVRKEELKSFFVLQIHKNKENTFIIQYDSTLKNEFLQGTFCYEIITL